jgi:regulation of enolase protein 1 (concanavalin A-like superfamily)
LIRETDGDFILETHVTDGEGIGKYGGLFIWKDMNNYIRFEVPNIPYWTNTIYYGANVNGKFIHPGVHYYDSKEAWLRLERKGDRFTGYVSSDGENWYRCGWTDIPMEDPIKVGIHALCPGPPTTSTRFEYFKIYRK